jgi:Glycosyltransferases, probably involved in cell wall biogenesis
MRRLTIFYGALIVITLSAACFLIGTFDILVAMLCGIGADVYVLYLAKQKKKMFVGGRFAPIMLIGVVPIVASILLFIFGYLGSNLLDAVYRTVTTTGFSIAFFITTYPILPAAKFKEIEDHFPDNKKAPLVSILVPAYNEQTVISRTITSLLATKYQHKEIIIIDDGSTDLTRFVAQGYEKQGVKVVTKPNGGKASALNYGLLFAKGDIVITIDADSMVTRDAVDKIVQAMESDPNNVAVAGNIKVLNSKSLLTKIQELEYIMAINTIRRAFALFGAVMVIPGAFGAFRKKTVEEVGGYDTDTQTEDFDITIKLLKTRGAVSSSSAAHAYTEVPSSWKSLYKQRVRWGTGTFQTILKHKDIFGNNRYGALHSFVFPIMIFSLLNPLASFIALGAGILMSIYGGVLLFARMMLVFMLIQVFVSLLALSIDAEDSGLAVYSPFFVFIYKQFIDYITLVSVIKALTKKEKKWHKLERAGGLEAISVGH